MENIRDKQNPAVEMTEEILRAIEAERVKNRVRPLAVCRKAGINGGCYSRIMQERGGRLSSVAAIADALGLAFKVVYKATGAPAGCKVGSWSPAIMKGNTAALRCSVCGLAHPVVVGAYPMRYCPACGAYNGQQSPIDGTAQTD